VAPSGSQAHAKDRFSDACDNEKRQRTHSKERQMDAFHPWTKYEIARLRDEQRLLRARDAIHVRELRKSQQEVGGASVPHASLLDRLLRREPATDGATVEARPV
jgi:hypothetical protein